MCRRFPFLPFMNRVPPSILFWTRIGFFGHSSFMIPFKYQFVLNKNALVAFLLTLKNQRCPHCDCSQSLNRHSILYGNDPASSKNQECMRGQRVFCSNRGLRQGCGRTFSVFLAHILPRFTVTAFLLWQLVWLLLDGKSVLAAAQSLGLTFAVQTPYALLRRLRLRLDVMRSFLCRIRPAPPSSHTNPLLQTIEHFRAAFPKADCPFQEFQSRFQALLFG